MPREPLDLADLPLPALIVRDGLVRAVTGPALTLLARPSSEVVDAPLTDLFDPAERDEVQSALVAPPALVHLAGSRRPVELAVSALPDGHLVVVHDRRDERRLSAILDAVADSTLLLDPDGRLLWQSDALASRVPDEVSLGSHPVERIHPEDLPIILETFASLEQLPGRRARHTVRSRAVDDDAVWQLIEVIGASRVHDPDLAGVVVQVRNLDEGAALESVGDTDGPLLSLAEAAPMGIVLMDATRHTVFANRVSRTLLELSGGGVDAWRERVTAAHQATLDQLVEAGLAGEETASATVSFQTPTGSSGWLRLRVVPHRGPAGSVVGVIVALEEVTAEVAARAETERLLHMLDITLDFVLIFRPDGEILHTNAALRHVLDRLWAEGGTGRLVDLLGVDAAERFVASAPVVLTETDTWQGELTVNIGGGMRVPVSVLGLVARDGAGEIDWIAMVARDITELKEAEERLRRTATLDHLTGLANRALFTDELVAAVDRSRSTGRPVAVLFCDLDRFKEVNDRLGHGAGDAVLSVVAERLREITREGDVAARVGGDEFVILCEGLGDAERLAGLADRVIASVQRPIAVEGEEVVVGISIGVALAHTGGVDGDRLLLAADQAMYRAKATGGNRYRVTEVDR
ncbi:MAG TPA: diguanylate cyclase [Acidimicrobiales bacterium]